MLVFSISTSLKNYQCIRPFLSHSVNAFSQLCIVSASYPYTFPLPIFEKFFILLNGLEMINNLTCVLLISTQLVRVGIHYANFNAQCIIPSAFWASFDAGIVSIQNLIQPIKPFGLSPVTDTYIN